MTPQRPPPLFDFDLPKLRAAVPQGVVDRALALIEPKADQRDACALQVRTHVALLRTVAAESANAPQPHVMKEVIDQKIEPALRRLQIHLDPKRPAPSHAFAVDLLFRMSGVEQRAFVAAIKRLIDAADSSRKALVVPKPSRFKWDDVKALAAKYADTLVRAFGARPPTKYAGGRFYALAALLYEAATGRQEDAGHFAQYCRQLGRIRGGIILKGLTLKA